MAVKPGILFDTTQAEIASLIVRQMTEATSTSIVAGFVTNSREDWKLVTGLKPRVGEPRERDEAALQLASPESGSFILVSLRRRIKGDTRNREDRE